jgi:hypothetical protein
LFSTKEFIAASRKFVCVRLESYESKNHQDMVRSFLGGRFENTAFCVLAPDGKTELTRASRGPSMVIGAQGRGPGSVQGSNEDVVNGMNEIAQRFRPKGEKSEMTLQDSHTFRQALNVASGDQRILVFVAAEASKQAELKARLQPLFADEEIIGRFHVDFANAASDAKWADKILYTRGKSGFVLIQADRFGQEGQAIAQLPLETPLADLKEALLDANLELAQTEERKVYSDHVSEGRREGVFFENGMPYGEDRDGDGVIDRGGGKGGKGKGKGRPPR